MAISKVSELVALTSADAGDELLITDVSANQSKKITKANLLSGYLTSYTETDPVFSASDAAGITSTDISNWNTAYGWGNHASAGYLTSETNDLTAAVTWANIPDANVPQSAVTQHQAALSITEGQISDLGGDIVLDSDIGVTVQAYDADTVKYDDVNPSFTDTGAIKVPTGNTSQQPGSPVAGQFRFNSETGQFEGYNGTAWGAIAGGGGGAGLQDSLMLMGA